MWFVLRFVALVLALGGAWSMTAAAHPSLGQSVSFDLEKKFSLSVQLDLSQKRSGHLDFSQDDDTGAWSLQATPSYYHGPDGADTSGLFVDREGSLSYGTLRALRKGWLPLVRSLDPTEGEDGNPVYVFEFATPVQISQLIVGGGSEDGEEDDSPTLSFYSDIAGTNLVTPFSYYQNCNQQNGAMITLVAPEVRRIVVAANALITSSPRNTGGGGSGTDVPEPATALLLVPGLALISMVHRRRRKTAAAQHGANESN